MAARNCRHAPEQEVRSQDVFKSIQRIRWPSLIREKASMDRRALIGLALLSAAALGLGSCGGILEGGRTSEGAGTYPKREITMVVQAAAGGTSDLVARTMAKEMEKVLPSHIV